MARANKQVPVTEERLAELDELKASGQTYDGLLRELVQEHRRRQLADRVREIREADSEALTSLEEL